MMEEGVIARRWLDLPVELRPFKAPIRSWRSILRADLCGFCGGPGGTIDHIVPRAAGGANDWTNLSGACQLCNMRKGDMTLLSFLVAQQEAAEAQRLEEQYAHPEPFSGGALALREGLAALFPSTETSKA